MFGPNYIHCILSEGNGGGDLQGITVLLFENTNSFVEINIFIFLASFFFTPALNDGLSLEVE